jgi:membrane protein involved in colicin uptake
MSKFLQWFTRSKEEVFFGSLLMIGMAAIALNASGFGHPIHLEVDNDALEKEYHKLSQEYEKAMEKKEKNDKMLNFEREADENRRRHDDFMRDFSRREKEMEQERKWQEREDSRLKELVRASREKCFIPEIDE